MAGLTMDKDQQIEELQALVTVLRQQLQGALDAACNAHAKLLIAERRLKEKSDG